MTLNNILKQIEAKQIVFQDVLNFINDHYNYTASAFINGSLRNEATENQGSARVLSAAQLAGLSKEETLTLFVEHYEAVLSDPNGSNHQNIRQFIAHGWDGISFKNTVLTFKS